VINN